MYFSSIDQTVSPMSFKLELSGGLEVKVTKGKDKGFDVSLICTKKIHVVSQGSGYKKQIR